MPDGTAVAGPVDLVIEDARWRALDLELLVARAARATFAGLGLTPERFEAVVLACDDGRIAALNGTFRGKAQATNVLSWPSVDRAPAKAGATPAEPDEEELGDMALAFDTCAREAEAQGKEMSDLVHGLLHLLGYDHERDADATLMERREVEILATLGVADPYRETGGCSPAHG